MQAESGAHGGAPEPSVWRRFGASVLLLVTGSLVTLAMFQALRAAEINDSERQFDAWTRERRDLLQKEVDGGLHILLGVRALFDSSEFVSAQEFDRYTAELITRYPHIFSLEWLPRVEGRQRAAFEKSASQELGTDYRIRQRNADTEIVPAAERSEYFPIYYVQAHDGLARLGIDAAARAANLRAIRIAARLNRLSASRVNIAKLGDEAVECSCPCSIIRPARWPASCAPRSPSRKCSRARRDSPSKRASPSSSSTLPIGTCSDALTISLSTAHRTRVAPCPGAASCRLPISSST
jgi:hypothetical protein